MRSIGPVAAFCDIRRYTGLVFLMFFQEPIRFLESNVAQVVPCFAVESTRRLEEAQLLDNFRADNRFSLRDS
jgi:hypothetical protein